LLRLDEKVVFSSRSGSDSFGPGWYVYAGRAYGPGGLRARIARHLKRSKTLRWHIDHLTSVAATAQAIAVEGGNECAIVGTLIGSGLFVCTANGFGASDCTTCPSHLLRPAAG
jgi:Uri superfamily endonuclease